MTLTLYHLLADHGPSFFCHLPLGPGAFPNHGVDAWLGWSQLALLQTGLLWLGLGFEALGFGPSLPSISKYVFIFWMGEG